MISKETFKFFEISYGNMNDSNVEFAEEIEDEPEVSLTLQQISEAVLYTTDWTTETIIAQFKRGNINLNPSYQRRDAWKIPRKSRFIESLILGLPIPQIVLAENRAEKGKYLVLDGKQRLLTLLQFTGNVDSKNSKFRLKNLDVRKDLTGLTFKELVDNIEFKEDINQFYNQPIRTVVIRNWPNIDFLHLVFIRLNTGSVKLSPQELRQALIPGDFMNYIEGAASESNAIKTLLKIDEPDFRMRDVELLLRYLSFIFYLNEYDGNLKKFMDECSKKLNKKWELEADTIRSQVGEYELAINAALEIFGKNEACRIWTGDEYQSKVNRAVIDIMAFYFSDKRIRERSLDNSLAVVNAFKNICVSDFEFKQSLETTTKSIGAVSTRLLHWGETLNTVLELNFKVPILSDRRIIFSEFW